MPETWKHRNCQGLWPLDQNWTCEIFKHRLIFSGLEFESGFGVGNQLYKDEKVSALFSNLTVNDISWWWLSTVGVVDCIGAVDIQ